MRTARQFLFVLSAAVLFAGCATRNIKLTAPEGGAEECLLKPIQLKYVSMPREARRAYFADEKCRQEMASEGFHPRKVTLSWEVVKPAPEYTVTLSSTPDFADGSCTEYTTAETSITVDNLMIAKTYYWKVSDGTGESKVSTFKTADAAPRLLRIPNVWNVRDLGGRIGMDGRRVKQNMVFRTGGLNNNASHIYYSFDELLEVNPIFRRNKETMDAAVQFIDKHADDMNTALISGEWVVYRPNKERFAEDDLKAVFEYREIPESIMGAEGVKMTTSESDHGIRLPNFKDSLPSVFMQYIDAPEDCLVPVSVGADWYWRLAINGDVVYDLWYGGNEVFSEYGNYTIALPVKKGRNLVTLALGSGSGGFSWFYGPVAGEKSNAEICAAAKKVINDGFRKIKIVKKDADGKDMFRKGAPTVTEEGRKYMVDILGIKSEIDLRSDGETMGMDGSPLGDAVKWFHISSSSYSGMNNAGGRKAFTEVFKVFLDEKNYPIDFHCIAGQDRTGAVAFIINALLGVPEDQLYLDWEVTGFWNTNVQFRHETLFDGLIYAFKGYEGETINERVENYVLSLGFAKADIQHLRDIMLEK